MEIRKDMYIDTVKCAALCRKMNKNGCCILTRYGCSWYEGKVTMFESGWIEKSAVTCEVTGEFMQFINIYCISCFIDLFCI